MKIMKPFPIKLFFTLLFISVHAKALEIYIVVYGGTVFTLIGREIQAPPNTQAIWRVYRGDNLLYQLENVDINLSNSTATIHEDGEEDVEFQILTPVLVLEFIQ